MFSEQAKRTKHLTIIRNYRPEDGNECLDEISKAWSIYFGGETPPVPATAEKTIIGDRPNPREEMKKQLELMPLPKPLPIKRR